MFNSLKLLWQQWFPQETNGNPEVERLAVLQQTAAARRAEYRHNKEQSALFGDASLSSPLATLQKRMEDAESAHISALQKWENKQSRQKSH